MKKSVLREIVRRVEALPGDAETKRLTIEVVREIALDQGVMISDQEDRVGFAIALLDARENRTVIRDRIIARHGVCPRTAQRDIEAALQLRHLRHEMTINVAQVGNTGLTENGIEEQRDGGQFTTDILQHEGH